MAGAGRPSSLLASLMCSSASLDKKHIQPSRMRIRLQLQHDLCISASPRHTVGCALSLTPLLSKVKTWQVVDELAHNTLVLSL
jgi:hypothetical protein